MREAPRSVQRNSTIPRHVGIIPDGTRRWCKQEKLDLETGYRRALSKLTDIVEYLYDQGVEAVSLYLLSSDNLERKPTELLPVLNAEKFMCQELLPPVIAGHEVAVTIAGDLQKLPNAFRIPWQTLASSPISQRRMYLCIAYHPIDEISATRTADSVSLKQLWVPEQLDLVIRTAGHRRLSNFLPLQSGYAELAFIPDLFNDITVDDISAVLNSYAKITRNYGS